MVLAAFHELTVNIGPPRREGNIKRRIDMGYRKAATRVDTTVGTPITTNSGRTISTGEEFDELEWRLIILLLTRSVQCPDLALAQSPRHRVQGRDRAPEAGLAAPLPRSAEQRR